LKVIESVGNPRIKLHPWLEQLSGDRDSTIPFKTLQLKRLCNFSEFVRNPLVHHAEIQVAYGEAVADISEMQNILNKDWDERTSATSQSRFYTAYSVVLGFTVILNILLQRFFEPCNPVLVEQSILMVNSIINLSDDAKKYRPLGSSIMPFSLITAWSAAYGTPEQARVEVLLNDYQSDFPHTKWMSFALWLDDHLGGRSPASLATHNSNSLANGCFVM
jgi:hypothetical protein